MSSSSVKATVGTGGCGYEEVPGGSGLDIGCERPKRLGPASGNSWLDAAG